MATLLSDTMRRLLPDPTFYASPRAAMEAPPETMAYVALINPTPGDGRPDAIAVVDCDRESERLGTTIGRLDPAAASVAFGPTAGFDIVGGDDGLSLAVLQPTGAAQSTLYRVNPRTGAATSLGAIGPAGTAPLRGFAIRLQ